MGISNRSIDCIPGLSRYAGAQGSPNVVADYVGRHLRLAGLGIYLPS